MPRGKRRIRPDVAAASALGGFYRELEPTRSGWVSCGRCKESSPTTDRGLCIRCWAGERAAARGEKVSGDSPETPARVPRAAQD